MKVTKERAAENRERVLQTAGVLFREHGFGGIGLADLMKNAGLTHGAFYGQFSSKDDLIAQACATALQSTTQRWARVADKADKASEEGSGSGLAKLVTSYLSKAHRDAPGSGCVMASLGADVARESPAVRAAVTEGTLSMLDLLARLMPEGTPKERRREAIATYATMIGAMVMARAVDDTALSDEILQAAIAAATPGSP